MCSDILRIVKDALEEFLRLEFLKSTKSLHLGFATDKLMKEPTVLAEPLPVWGQCKSVVPPDQLTAHLQSWSVGVDSAPLVKKGTGILHGVEDKERLVK